MHTLYALARINSLSFPDYWPLCHTKVKFSNIFSGRYINGKRFTRVRRGDKMMYRLQMHTAIHHVKSKELHISQDTFPKTFFVLLFPEYFITLFLQVHILCCSKCLYIFRLLMICQHYKFNSVIVASQIRKKTHSNSITR